LADFDSTLRVSLEGLLETGEELRGICAASQQRGLFKGGAVALGVTDRRLILQPLNRRGKPEGEALSILPTEVESAHAGAAGDEWYDAEPSLLAGSAVTLKIRTTGGEKLKLMMMHGEGLLGGLGGGEAQRRGVEALAAWFRALDAAA
jgi:hypothetical protein